MERLPKELKRKILRQNAEGQHEDNAPQPHDLVNLQRLVGNQAVQRMVESGQINVSPQPATFIQTKLSVGAADDAYEQEADRVAQQVVNTPDVAQREDMQEEDPSAMAMKRIQREDIEEPDDVAAKRMDIQREDMQEEEMVQQKRADIQREDMQEEEMVQQKRADIQREGELEEEMVQQKRADIQREGAMEEEEMVQQKRADIQRAADMSGAFEVGGDVEQQIQAQKGSGQALSGDSQEFFESRFGYDFSGVKVHNDAQSDSLNRSLSARAFTNGSDIFFRQGEYNPGTKSGQELMAHELTHVVQQGGAGLKTKKDDNEN